MTDERTAYQDRAGAGAALVTGAASGIGLAVIGLDGGAESPPWRAA